MRRLAALALLCCWGTAVSTTDETALERPADEYGNPANAPPTVIRLFDLHDPELANSWPGFLATTPMQNDELLPAALQNRLANLVATYRSLTPVGHPAFFVATYFDVLSERLLANDADDAGPILPMQVCPVFASGSDAAVSSLLAVASGLPDALFVNAPGQPERYRYLFLQTEYSHCRFLATIQAPERIRRAEQTGMEGRANFADLSFEVGMRSYTATLGSRQELRALLEAVGEVDAVSMFRQHVPGRSARDEAEVLRFIRLLSLLATDGKSGYAAIPVLFPLLSDEAETPVTGSLRIADALDLAYQVRDAFRHIVPFPIRDTDELLKAKLAVMEARAKGGEYMAADERIAALLDQFVNGSDLLLATTTQ